MLKKRTSPDSSIDRQANEGSDSFQQDDKAKRPKLTMSVTTLQDLPPELIECILIKAIVMEVKSMKLAKSVWKEKADLVIEGLRWVCSQWSQILTTNFLRNEIHRTLDRTAEETIRLEILHQSPLETGRYQVATIKDEIFLFCWAWDQDHFISVYDRNNTAVVKDVISLKGTYAYIMAACSLSNCLYMLNRQIEGENYSVLRISRDDENRFTVSQLISDLYLPRANFCVAANGSLILSSRPTNTVGAIVVYDANGSFQQRLWLPLDEYSLYYYIIPKPNENLVWVQLNAYGQYDTKLMEFALNGSIIRQYQSSVNAFCSVTNADSYGRILMYDRANKMELLDSEFNLLEFSGPQLPEYRCRYPQEMCYNSESNEIVAVANFPDSTALHLTVFRLS